MGVFFHLLFPGNNFYLGKGAKNRVLGMAFSQKKILLQGTHHFFRSNLRGFGLLVRVVGVCFAIGAGGWSMHPVAQSPEMPILG